MGPHGTGLRHRHVAPPRGLGGPSGEGQGRPHRGEAPQRPHGHHPTHLPAAPHPVSELRARSVTPSSTRVARPRRPRPGRSPSPATVREIYRRLKDHFGRLEPPRRLDPLDELILTVLSQNTSDVNRDRAYQAMRRRYPAWQRLADADVASLADVIRPGGLANIKAPRILSILRTIWDREGGSLDLSWMRGASSARVREYLMSLPGVGP